MKRILLLLFFLCSGMPIVVSQSYKSELEIGVGFYQDFAYPEAINHLKKAVELGSNDAHYYIGMIHLNAVTEDYDKDGVDIYKLTHERSKKEFQKGAEKGDIKCIPFYAKNLLKNSNKKDSVTAIERLNFAAKNGNGAAYVVLADLAKTYEERINLYTKALEFGEKPYSQLAYAYSAIHNYEKAREYGERFLFEQDACHTIEQRELGNIFNMSDYRSVLFLLGQSCYHLGDFNSAQKYLNIFYRVNYGKDYGYAFSSHDSEALNYLGYTSLFKLQNIDKGLHCFEISALTMDNADSYTRLGDYYSNNYPEASSLGCWPLNFYLFAQDGKKKMNAMETVKTIVDSKYLNKSVVNNLCFDENYILGLCLQNGLCGLVRDTIQAIAFFKKVVQQQNVPQIVKENAWFQLGHLSKDKALKIKCFKSSADMGGVAALTPLCYEKYNSWDEAMKFAKSAGFNDYYFDVINTLPLGRSSEDYLKRAEIFYELYKKGYLFFDIHCYDSPKFMWKCFTTSQVTEIQRQTDTPQN